MQKPSSQRNFIIFSLAILLFGAAWVWFTRAPADTKTSGRIPAPRAGFLAPEFALPTMEGETIALSDLRGRPVLLNIWATWCPPCRAEMPAFERVYEDYKDQGIVILAVNAINQDNLSDVASFVETYQLTFPVLLDTQDDVSRMYQVRSLPTSFLINKDGTIREVILGGPMSEASLRAKFEQMVEEGS